MSMQALRMDLACTAMAFLLPTFGKRPRDQGDTSRKRTTATRPATEQTPGTPADAEATMQDPGNAPLLRCSGSAAEPDAATEHIAPAAFGLAGEADAAALRNAVQTLQRGVQAEIRNLCTVSYTHLTLPTKRIV